MKYKKGYTLLFSVLTAALVLGVASFILGFAKKQALLSSTAKESMYAIYAADSGMECLKVVIPSGIASVSPPIFHCNGYDYGNDRVESDEIIVDKSGNTHDFKETVLTFHAIPLDANTCAKITVKFGMEENSTGGVRPKTTYESRGYNRCTEVAGVLDYDKTFPKIVERGIQIVEHGIW